MPPLVQYPRITAIRYFSEAPRLGELPIKKHLRFRFHHELELFYQGLADELVRANLPERQTAKILQHLLRSRHDSLKYWVSAEETHEFTEIYPEE